MTTEYGITALRNKDKLLLESVADLFDSDEFEHQVNEVNVENDPNLKANIATANAAKSTTPKPKSIMPSPTPLAMPVDVVSKSDIRSDGSEPDELGQSNGDQWKDELDK